LLDQPLHVGEVRRPGFAEPFHQRRESTCSLRLPVDLVRPAVLLDDRQELVDDVGAGIHQVVVDLAEVRLTDRQPLP
jgi:hypothetical protein